MPNIIGNLGEITLNLRSPLKILIVALMPDDPIVRGFIGLFRQEISAQTMVSGEVSIRNWEGLFGLQNISYSYSAVLFVTHGNRVGQPATQIESPGSEIVRWENIAQWFASATTDKLVLLATCQSGRINFAEVLLHVGQALHVVTPCAGTDLEVDAGAKAMADFLNRLAVNYDLTPEKVQTFFDETESSFPRVLDLWPYSAEHNRHPYLPSTRR